MKKLAVLRGSGVGRECPYGLSVSVSCKNVGDAIYSMEALKAVAEEDIEKQKQANRRLYRHSAEGKPCPFLEGVVKSAKYDTVNCDAEDSSPGMHEAPFRPSPYYPRVFTGLSTTMQTYTFNSYEDFGRGQMTDGLFRSMYAAHERDYWIVEGELEKTASLDAPATIPQLADLGPPNNQWFQAYVIDESGRKVESSEVFDNIESAKAWAENRKGPGAKVELEGQMSWWPPGAVKDEHGIDYGFSSEEELRAAAKVAPQLVRARIIGQSKDWYCRALELFVRWQSLNGEDFIEQYRKFEEVDPQEYEVIFWHTDEEPSFHGPYRRPKEVLELKTASTTASLKKQASALDPNDPLSHPMLQACGQPDVESYAVEIWDGTTNTLDEVFRTGSFQSAQKWLEDHKGPGKRAAIGGLLKWEPSKQTQDLIQQIGTNSILEDNRLVDSAVIEQLKAAEKTEPALVSRNNLGGGWEHPTYIVRGLILTFYIKESESGERKIQQESFRESRVSFIWTEDRETWGRSGLAPETLDLSQNNLWPY